MFYRYIMLLAAHAFFAISTTVPPPSSSFPPALAKDVAAMPRRAVTARFLPREVFFLRYADARVPMRAARATHAPPFRVITHRAPSVMLSPRRCAALPQYATDVIAERRRPYIHPFRSQARARGGREKIEEAPRH